MNKFRIITISILVILAITSQAQINKDSCDCYKSFKYKNKPWSAKKFKKLLDGEQICQIDSVSKYEVGVFFSDQFIKRYSYDLIKKNNKYYWVENDSLTLIYSIDNFYLNINSILFNISLLSQFNDSNYYRIEKVIYTPKKIEIIETDSVFGYEVESFTATHLGIPNKNNLEKLDYMSRTISTIYFNFKKGIVAKYENSMGENIYYDYREDGKKCD